MKNSTQIMGWIGTAVAVIGLGITMLMMHDSRVADDAAMKEQIKENSRQIGMLWQRSSGGGNPSTRPSHP